MARRADKVASAVAHMTRHPAAAFASRAEHVRLTSLVSADAAVFHVFHDLDGNELLGGGVPVADAAFIVAFRTEFADERAFSAADFTGSAGLAILAFSAAEAVPANDPAGLLHVRSIDADRHFLLRSDFLHLLFHRPGNLRALQPFGKHRYLDRDLSVRFQILLLDRGFNDLLSAVGVRQSAEF